ALHANTLAKEAILSGVITELQGYGTAKNRSKIRARKIAVLIFFLCIFATKNKPKDCYIEVKSVTLLGGRSPVDLDTGQGYFPDTWKTQRGQKHLRELINVARNGHRAVLLFTVLHSGIERSLSGTPYRCKIFRFNSRCTGRRRGSHVLQGYTFQT
ncbi:DNA/RNA nuclease SfsA, partial [Vibrio sp. PP-XX7]